MTGNFGDANKMGLNSAAMGGSLGGVTGGFAGYKYAKQHDLNPWTGKWTGEISNNSNFRTEARNLTEQLSLKEALSGQGTEIMTGEINDRRWLDWQKMQHVHRGETPRINITNGIKTVDWVPTPTTLHYWKNPYTGETSGFKFKK